MHKALRLIFPVVMTLCVGLLSYTNYLCQQLIANLDKECSGLVIDVAEARAVATGAVMESVMLKHKNDQLNRQVDWLERLRTP
jgi:hypothetical protein